MSSTLSSGAKIGIIVATIGCTILFVYLWIWGSKSNTSGPWRPDRVVARSMSAAKAQDAVPPQEITILNERDVVVDVAEESAAPQAAAAEQVAPAPATATQEVVPAAPDSAPPAQEAPAPEAEPVETVPAPAAADPTPANALQLHPSRHARFDISDDERSEREARERRARRKKDKQRSRDREKKRRQRAIEMAEGRTEAGASSAG